MSSGPSHLDRPRWHWWVLLLCATGAVVFGLVGFLEYDKLAPFVAGQVPLPLYRQFVAAVYETLGLFALHTPDFGRPINNWLEWARLLATIVSFWTISGAVHRVYSAEFHHFRMGFTRNHVIVCGAGWRGLALVHDFSAPRGGRRGDKVIVIEKDPHAPGLQRCDELGIPYVIADASAPRALRAAGIARARLLIATCQDDGINLEIALRARELADALRVQAPPLKCYIQLSNRSLRAMARRQNLIAVTAGRIELSTTGLDIYENSARELFARFPLDWQPILAKSDLQVHLLIVGFGDMGESVLVQAARIGHFANGVRLRVSIVDRDAAARQAELNQRFPDLNQICEVEFRALDANDPAFLAWVAQACEVPDRVVTVVLCLPDDPLNLALALRLSQDGRLKAGRCPIRVRISSQFGLAALLVEKRQHELFGDQIRPFGMLEQVCNREALEQPELDALARIIHSYYVEQERLGTDGHPKNAVVVPWQDLSEDLQASNRHSADHMEIKLRAIGYHSTRQTEAAEGVTEFLPAQIEVLARIEHHRFCAERLLAGWRFAPGPKDPVNKTSPTLVPWAELSEAERDKDRQHVRHIPDLLASAGRSISR